MARMSAKERDQVLDMLGKRQGHPKPIPYSVVTSRTGHPRAKLRAMVFRDKRRNGVEANGTNGERTNAGETNERETNERTEREERLPVVRFDPEDVRFTPQQRLALESLAVGESNINAAEFAGVVPRTIRKWKRQPGFAAALEDALDEHSEQVRRTLREVAGQALAQLKERLDAGAMDDNELRLLATMALDRTGHGKSSTVEHAGGVTVTHGLEDKTDAELDAELAALEADGRADAIDLHEQDGAYGVEE